MKFRRTAALLTALGLGFGMSLPGLSANAETQLKIDLLAITDLHGHLPQVTQGDTITEIGAAVMACEVDRYRAANPNTMFVSVGDNIGASAWVSAAAYDDPTIEVLNAMGLDASAVGNHEFDTGWLDLNSRIAGGPRLNFDGTAASPAHTYTAPNFAYLGANAEGMVPELPSTSIIETADGVRVAFIGAVTADMPSLVPSAAIAGVQFTDPAASVNAQAATVVDQDLADAVVALVHEDANAIAAQMSSDVDVILGGHSHVEYVDNAAVGAEGQPIVALQPANFAQRLGHVEITVDTDTGAVSATARNLSGADMSAGCLADPDAEVAQIVADAQAYADVQGKVPVAKIAGSFYRGQLVNLDGAVEENRGTESTMSNLVADGARYWGQTLANPDNLPVVGVANAGGVRGDLVPDAEGNVTYEDVRTIQPFAGTKGYNTMTGALVYDLLEQQWQAEGASRPMLKLGLSANLRYTFDPDGTFDADNGTGTHILEVWIDDELVPRDDSRSYRFVGDAFVLKGGDGYRAFKPENYTDSGMLDLDVFIEYLSDSSEGGSPVHPDYVTRATGLQVPDVLVAGQVTPIRVTGLAMSAPTDVRPTTLTVKHGEEVLGTAPVTFDNVLPGDGINRGELGEARVTVTIPADMASGVTQLTFFTDMVDAPIAQATVIIQGADMPAPKDPTVPSRPGLPGSGV